MLYYVFEEYKNKILKENNVEFLEELKKLDTWKKVAMFAMIIFALLYYITYFLYLFKKINSIIISNSCFVIVMITAIYIFIRGTKEYKTQNLNNMDKYYEDTIKSFVKLLKFENNLTPSMFNENSIAGLIKLCDAELEAKKIRTNFSAFKNSSVSLMLCFVQNLLSVTKLELKETLIIITLSCALFCMGFGLYLMLGSFIFEFIDRKQILLRSMRADLYYIQFNFNQLKECDE